jgi:NAD kinase
VTDGLPPRVVLVTRDTEYQALLAEHGTHQQAEFFLDQRGQAIEPLVERHRRRDDALGAVLAAIPVRWRRTRVPREELARFLFAPDDVVVVLGQDGLVANVAKYLNGQPVLGFNPNPDLYDGLLVQHSPAAAGELMVESVRGGVRYEERTMVEAVLDDGQRLLALNEVFVGHATHQSARYHIEHGGDSERHSSSGLIVATGTGSTGWARSIVLERGSPLPLPAPTEDSLVFLVREAFPSVTTGVSLTEGLVRSPDGLAIVSEMNDGGVVFGDGIERDYLKFDWGRRLEVRRGGTSLRLVVA